ncbi:MAG: hypothetical protein R3325_06860 [Thermoanaerobaculia bacterium]|nr:hypothetical protein [Thermoanaerobaculia bacterium]
MSGLAESPRPRRPRVPSPVAGGTGDGDPVSETPLLWMVAGHRAGVVWCPSDGRYTASIGRIPGIWGRGATRTAALAALARAVRRLG